MNLAGDITHSERDIDQMSQAMRRNLLQTDIWLIESDISRLEQDLQASPPAVMWSDEEKQRWADRSTPEWRGRTEAELSEKRTRLEALQTELTASRRDTSASDFDFRKTTAVEAIRSMRPSVLIRRAEDDLALRAALESAQSGDFDHSLVTEDRENALLQIVAGNGDDVAVTVFGAAHDWRDAIGRWNADPENVRRRFSFVQITPLFFPQ